MTTLVTCEICNTEVSAYSIWLDVDANTQHFTCGDFHCDCEFDGDNAMEFVEEVN